MMPPTSEERLQCKRFIRLGLQLARWPAWLTDPFFAALYRSMAKADTPRVQQRMARQLPADSAQDALDEKLFHFMSLSGKTNQGAGPAGVRQEMQLYGADASSFAFGDVRVPFTIMHGENDVNVPLAVAERVASHVPHARMCFTPAKPIPSGGHVAPP